MAQTVLHLRSETKAFEHRSALTPTTTKKLVEAGFKVNVEKSPERIFDDDEFATAGAELVEEGSWVKAPTDHLIIGLKELPEEEFALSHTHIQFAHCYKNQSNWDTVLGRFPSGNGTLLDLEFLQDESGRRVAAFGYHAGYAGAAMALLAWANQIEFGTSKPLKDINHYPNKDALISDVKDAIQAGTSKGASLPRVLVIGALGRCGRGAVDLCRETGVPDENIVKWDLAETSAKSGPYQEIVESDIFVNCIYLDKPIPPFVTKETLSSSSRNLSVVCDVSCDTTNPHNPIPIYSICTTFDKPTVPVEVENEPPLCVISIDHLPSLLPREASEAFSEALLPSLLQLNQRATSRVWQQAEQLFKEKVLTLPQKTKNLIGFTKGISVPAARP